MNQEKYHLFVSYASEDKDFVRELVGALKGQGLNVWYDETEVKVGDIIVDKVNEGLSQSSYGIIVLSEDYFKKGWPQYEKRILIHQYIEDNKILFPIWHKIDKKRVKENDPHLASIFSLKSTFSLQSIVSQIMEQMKDIGKTIAKVPGYEDPVFRFFQGRGELNRVSNGGAFTLWEAVLYLKDDEYPLQIGSNLYTKDYVLYEAWNLYLGGGEYLAKKWVGEENAKKIKRMLKEEFGFI